ncbi:MAG: hypothetical protein AAF074_01370 [Pseudomonadota bacterium]
MSLNDQISADGFVFKTEDGGKLLELPTVETPFDFDLATIEMAEDHSNIKLSARRFSVECNEE